MSTLKVKGISAPTGYDLAMPTGHILQVVNTILNAQLTTTSTSWQSGMTLAITPKFSTSKIFLLWHGQLSATGSTDAQVRFFRGTTSGTVLGTVANNFMTGTGEVVNASNVWLDSPSTTSSQTYTVAYRGSVNGQTIKFGNASARSNFTLMEVAG